MSHDCTSCALHEYAITVCVDSRGPVDARILVVGQNPGAQESLQGEAFVGPSGKLLTALLIDAGYEPNRVRLTNAVRCETAGNRPPTPTEIDACRRHLFEEIHLVRPQGIIALGDTALRSLCKTSGIKSKRGSRLPLHKSFEYICDVWPTYHPAFVLRSPNFRQTVVSDLRRVLDEAKPDEVVTYEVVPTSYADRGRGQVLAAKVPVAFDIETDYKGDNRVTLISAAVPGKVVVARTSEEQHVLLKRIDELVSYGCTPVTHNGWAFDLPQLIDREMLRADFPLGRDTMAMAYLVDETQSLGLENLCVKYLRVKGWKEAKDAEPGTAEHALYGARDAAYTLRLYEYLLGELGERIRYHDELLRPMHLALSAISRRGVYIDAEAVLDAGAKATSEVVTAKEKLLNLAGPNFNPNSTTQVAAFLQTRGLQTYFTETGKPSTSKHALAAMRGNDFVDALKAYRSATKRLSTYIKPYSGVERVHPEYTILRTATGRTSAKNPNVQNLDRELDFFSAPPGKMLVKVDYSAIEFRVAAWCAQERVVLDAYAADPDWDPHTAFARKFYKRGHVDANERQTAKSANFSQLYLGNDETLFHYAAGMGVELSRTDAMALHRGWHEWLPGFRKWYRSVATELRGCGYVETAVGFRRHYGEPGALRGDAFNAALREAVNVKVQNLAYAIAALGVRNLHEAGYELVLFVHDSVGFEVGGCFDSHDKSLVEHLMCRKPIEQLWDLFGVRFDVPLTVKFSVKEGGMLKSPEDTDSAS